MDKIDIYWFSGTGNTLLLALELEKKLSEKGRTVRLLAIEKSKPENIDPDAMLGIVVAVAEQGTYRNVWNFLENLPEVNGTKSFLLDSLGYYSGGILGPVKKILKRKGFKTIAAKEIIMPNNFYKKRSKPEKELIKREKGMKKVAIFADRLISGKGYWFDIPVYSTLISLFSRSDTIDKFYQRLLPVVFHDDKCTRCNICVKICPSNHINRTGENAPENTNYKCLHCLRCFGYCPVKAITIGNKNNVPYHAVPLPTLQKYMKMGN